MPPRRTGRTEPKKTDLVDTELFSHFTSDIASLEQYLKGVESISSMTEKRQDFMPTILATIQAGLVSNPKKWLITEPAALDAIGIYAPEAIRECLLEFLGTVSTADELFTLTILRLKLLGPAKSLEKLNQVISVVEPSIKPRIIENLWYLCDMTIGKVLEGSIQICEQVWTVVSDKDKHKIFQFMSTIELVDSFLDCWRDRALQCLGSIKSIKEFYPIFTFLISCCRSRESADKIFEHLQIHTNLKNFEEEPVRGNKRARKTFGEEEGKPMLIDCFRILVENKFFLEAFKAYKTLTNPVFFIFMILSFRIPSEQKFVLQVLKDADKVQLEALQRSCKYLLSQSNAEHLSSITKLARTCAQQGTFTVTSVLIVEAFNSASQYDSRDLIAELTGYITDPKSCTWGLQLLEVLSVRSPDLIYRYQSTLRIILDHLDRFQDEFIRKYYECMIRLAVYASTQQGDYSNWNELLVIFRKQVGSLDPKVRRFGAHAILSIVSVLFSLPQSIEDDSMTEEATCSQAPRRMGGGNQHGFLDTFLSLLEPSLSMVNCDFASVRLLCTKLPLGLSQADPDVVSSINKRISSIFEQSFIYELTSSSLDQTCFSLDEEEALIGISFFDKASYISGATMPYLFHLLQWSEKVTHHGDLDNIDALLGCPVKFEDGEITSELAALCEFVLINWLRVLVNAFNDQDDKEVQRKCLERLVLLAQRQTKLDDSTQKLMGSLMVLKDGEAQINTHSLAKVDNQQLDLQTEFDDEEFLASLNISNRDVAVSEKSSGKVKTFAELLIPIEPKVFFKFLSNSKVAGFLCTELSTFNFPSWSQQDLERILAELVAIGVESRLTIIIMICEELHRRKVDIFEKSAQIIAGTNAKNLDNDEIVALLQLMALSKRTPEWDQILCHSEEYIFTLECSAPEAARILEKLSLVSQDHPRLVESILSRLNSNDSVLWKKKLSIHTCLCSTISMTSLDSLYFIEASVKQFEKLVQIGRSDIEAGFAEPILKYGRIYIERFINEAIPLLRRSFLSSRNQILDCFKVLQQSTRSLQIICNHLKPQRLPKYQSLLPPTRRVLEALLYNIKQLLQANNCLSAFWIGNLKHRSIDGAEASSQVPLELSESDSEEQPVEGLSKDLISTDDDPDSE